MISNLEIDPAKLNNKNILITGGTGSFGNKLVKTLIDNFKPNKIIIYSRDEYKQSLMKEIFKPADYPFLRYFIGDVRDLDRLNTAFKDVDLVIHTSALKRIVECEYNPMEAIKTNILGTDNVVQAAINNKVKYVVGLSTDKACSPVNHYGATKLCAEKLLINGNIMSGGFTKFAVCRYGNQFNSRGSLIEIFKKQINNGNDLTVTDITMTRFTILLQEAVHFVLNCYDKMIGGEIFIPKLPSYSLEQIITCFNTNYRIIGIRPGEKLHEFMISPDESHIAYETEEFYLLIPLTEHNLKTFDFNQYDTTKFRKLNPGESYSSGNNLLIDNERLLKLISDN